MKQEFLNYQIDTKGLNLYDFTDDAIDWIKKKRFNNGIINLSIQHTSASLIVQENVDSDFKKDL